MNAIIENIVTRRSVKKYLPDSVPEELVAEVVKAGMYAPSGMNKQSAKILAVTNKEMRDRLSRLNLSIVINRDLKTSSGHGDPFYGAPVVLVVLAKKECGTRVYDGSLVMENMMLAAESLGVNTCWIHRAKEEFESEEGKEILRSLGVEGDYVGIGHVALGYAMKPIPAPKPRKENYVIWAK